MAEQEPDSSKCVDWSKCVLCQNTTTEALQSPENLRRSDIDHGTGYHTLANNILRFHEIDSLPVTIDIKKLDDGGGIASTFTKRSAKWHKTCYNKFNKLRFQRAVKRKSLDTPSCSLPTKFTRNNSGARSSNLKSCCFFCDDSSGPLHQASTFNVDERVRKCALQLGDKMLLAKLSAGDLISQDAVYHSKCLVALYNKAQRSCDYSENRDEKVIQGIALAQLVAYIEDARTDSEDGIPVFRLAELTQMYSTRLQQLGGDTSTRVHSTDLKDRILANVPGLQAHKQGRDVMLAFNEDIGHALKNLYEQDFDSQAMILSQAAKIIRQDVLNTTSKFNGTFASNC